MGQVAALGERARVAGFALAGVSVLPAENPQAVREAWRALPAAVSLVILTPAAAEALGRAVVEGTRPLVVVMPP
jgi:vacuolar-type H+-ATPase subunit F/Vma7